MPKNEALFVFVDTRASTKRIYDNLEYFEDFITSTLNFIINKFSINLAFPSCKAKALGDGLLIYYVSSSSFSKDEHFNSVLQGIVKASIACVDDYHTEMMKIANIRERARGQQFQLGISIGGGYLYDFEYKDKPNNIEVFDIGSINLTYVFRLNKFATPEGIVVQDDLYENYKSVFDSSLEVFVQKRKFIDDAFGDRKIYTSKKVSISDEAIETDVVLQAYRDLAQFSIEAYKEFVELEIMNSSYTYDSPPPIRFMLFRCSSEKIEEVYSNYNDYEGSQKSKFPIKPVEEIVSKDGKYPLLFYECYYEKKIVFFSYTTRYIKDVDKYIAQSRVRFALEKTDEEAKALFSSFAMAPSSALAIPIMDAQDKAVNWIIALDSAETSVFKKSFYAHIGTTAKIFFNTRVRAILEPTDKP